MSIIIQIITAIMALFENCKKPTQDAIRSGRVGMIRRAQLSMILRRQGCDNCVAIANAMVDEALSSQQSRTVGAGPDWVDQFTAAAESEIANAA